MEDRNTLLTIRCILGKSGVAEQVRDDADEEDEEEEMVEDGRLDRTAYVPRLIVTKGYTATSSGGRCIINVMGGPKG